jgi:hypothetical protein
VSKVAEIEAGCLKVVVAELVVFEIGSVMDLKMREIVEMVVELKAVEVEIDFEKVEIVGVEVDFDM